MRSVVLCRITEIISWEFVRTYSNRGWNRFVVVLRGAKFIDLGCTIMLFENICLSTPQTRVGSRRRTVVEGNFIIGGNRRGRVPGPWRCTEVKNHSRSRTRTTSAHPGNAEFRSGLFFFLDFPSGYFRGAHAPYFLTRQLFKLYRHDTVSVQHEPTIYKT